MDILLYAKQNKDSFEMGNVSSNQIHTFDFEGKRYVLKTPLMVGDNLSPFWFMMRNVFRFTFEKQNAHLEEVYATLKTNPHIPVAPLVAADSEAMLYEYIEGNARDADEFPDGADNAYRLGQYVGYNHRIAHINSGIIGAEDVTDFYASMLSHMEECIRTHWNSEDPIDKKVREYFASIKEMRFVSSKYSLMMVDMSADQFLYDGENIVACVDLDAYVIGPVEWELSLLKTQISDWERFRTGYEMYQPMPEFEEASKRFFFLMALNVHWDKQEMEGVLQ